MLKMCFSKHKSYQECKIYLLAKISRIVPLTYDSALLHSLWSFKHVHDNIIASKNIKKEVLFIKNMLRLVPLVLLLVILCAA